MIRFAIWTAVSSGPQAADDKFSLIDQENICRERALSRGWRETQPPFIVRGQSRTQWVNLRDAEDAIPPLRIMLDAAKKHEFDILVLYDYTRLRDLLDPVAKVLSDYHVQIYSVTQPTEPISAEQFDTYGSEVEETLRFAHGFASRAEINALRKRYRDNMPIRVTVKGLHSVGPLPSGYRKPPSRELDHDAIPILDHSRASIILDIKDRFLAGQSLPQIAEWLNAAHIPSAKGGPWKVQTIRGILVNPYYAGIVNFRSIRRLRDRRTGKIVNVRVTDPEKIITGQGKHAPLWDIATHRRILEEFKARGHSYRGRAAAHLSRILECSCGARMWAFYDCSKVDIDHRRWRCSTHSREHASIRENILLPAIAARIAERLRDIDNLRTPPPVDNRPLLQHTLIELQARLTRWETAYEQGLEYSEYTRLTQPIKDQIHAVRKKLSSADDSTQKHQLKLSRITELAQLLDKIPNYILTASPQVVNTQLRTILKKIIVDETGDFDLVFW